MANENLSKAKNAKNDEFYTVYDFIQKEVNAYLEYNPDVFRGKTVLLPCDDPEWSNFTKFFAQNFESLGLKKLISTSFSKEKKEKMYPVGYQFSIFDLNQTGYDERKSKANGKIFTLTRDNNKSNAIDIHDLQWQYLEGDGDFRSDEIQALRDEADFIITNPPFSLFREFVSWIVEADKNFLIIGNQNAITYKEIFPLIKDNKLWLGATCNSEDMVFSVPEGTDIAPKDREKATKLGYIGNYTRLGNSNWFTNIDHGRRHQPLSLMTMADNLKFSKHKEIREFGYQTYDNYDAIEIPYTDAIPSDYDGIMGVPISFLPKYSPEQFEILGMCENLDLYGLKTKVYTTQECQKRYFELFGKKGTYDLNASGVVNGNKVYQRILIRKRVQA
ncbi:MAG: DNA methyltransferase [Ruminococcaceae bacterium]|nr:DNA methyltransferase [Oscillospiraceae bacterium]